MNSRREIPLTEMRAIVDALGEVKFNIESSFSIEDQDRLAQVVFYLLKYNCGVNSVGVATDRYGRYEDYCEAFHRKLCEVLLAIGHANPNWRTHQYKGLKTEATHFYLDKLIYSLNGESNKSGLNLAISICRYAWQVLPQDVSKSDET